MTCLKPKTSLISRIQIWDWSIGTELAYKLITNNLANRQTISFVFFLLTLGALFITIWEGTLSVDRGLKSVGYAFFCCSGTFLRPPSNPLGFYTDLFVRNWVEMNNQIDLKSVQWATSLGVKVMFDRAKQNSQPCSTRWDRLVRSEWHLQHSSLWCLQWMITSSAVAAICVFIRKFHTAEIAGHISKTKSVFTNSAGLRWICSRYMSSKIVSSKVQKPKQK